MWSNQNYVTFSEPMPVTNAACCSDGRVMCEKCAAAALDAKLNQSPATSSPSHEPLGLPTWNFEVSGTKNQSEPVSSGNHDYRNWHFELPPSVK